MNKIAISRLDMLLDEAAWQQEQKNGWHSADSAGTCIAKQSDFFDIIGFKQFLFDHTEMSHGTVREYVVRLRRLGNHLSELNISVTFLTKGILMRIWSHRLPTTSTNNYRIALRKYAQFKAQSRFNVVQRSLSVLDLIYIKNE